MNLLSILRVVTAVGPLLAQLPLFIRAAEDTFGSGTGAQKKEYTVKTADAVLDSVAAGLKVKELQNPALREAIRGVVGGATDLGVNLMNGLGILRHGDPIDAAPSGGR